MEKKYYTCEVEIRGTLTIGVVAENEKDAQRIAEHIFDDEHYYPGDISVDKDFSDVGEVEEATESDYDWADYVAKETECNNILEFLD